MTPLAQEFSILIMAVGSFIGRPIVRAVDTGSKPTAQDALEALPEETERLRQALTRAVKAMGTMQDYHQKEGQPQ